MTPPYHVVGIFMPPPPEEEEDEEEEEEEAEEEERIKVRAQRERFFGVIIGWIKKKRKAEIESGKHDIPCTISFIILLIFIEF